jgi:anti-sigma regulatory factor (Ser/Thr protein kinase)
MITFEVDNLINMNVALQDFLNYLTQKNVSEDEVFDCRLVSCELITNVIRHCGESAYFKGSLRGGKVFISVSSKNTEGLEIKPKLPDVFSESGRGLYIINAICGGDMKVVGNEIKVSFNVKEKC